MKRTQTTVSCNHGKRRAVSNGVAYLFDALKDLVVSDDYLVEYSESDITRWEVTIRQDVIRPYTYKLANDLHRWSIAACRPDRPAAVKLAIRFPHDYPRGPPFVRVVWPRFRYQTGHVTVGGSICTEMLTNQGWTEMSVDALLRNVMVLFADGDGRLEITPSVHHPNPFADYDEVSAGQAFHRMLLSHGWK